jgi:hypothetical protein
LRSADKHSADYLFDLRHLRACRNSLGEYSFAFPVGSLFRFLSVDTLQRAAAHEEDEKTHEARIQMV